MDISSLTASTRLMDAFEKMGVSEGSGLVSSGPSPAPKELVQKFEALMRQGPEQGTEMRAEQANAALDSAQAGKPHAAQGTAPLDKAAAPDAVRPASDAGRAGQGTAPAETPLLSHMDLYRLQFQIAMLKVQGETGSQISQKAAQGMDSLLRQQS